MAAAAAAGQAAALDYVAVAAAAAAAAGQAAALDYVAVAAAVAAAAAASGQAAALYCVAVAAAAAAAAAAAGRAVAPASVVAASCGKQGSPSMRSGLVGWGLWEGRKPQKSREGRQIQRGQERIWDEKEWRLVPLL